MAKLPKVAFNCLLPVDTIEAIKKQAEEDKCSQADVVARAVAALQMEQAQGRISTNPREPDEAGSREPSEGIHGDGSGVHSHVAHKVQRGIREKGDDKR